MNNFNQYESAISTLIGSYIVIAFLAFIIPIIFFITLWLNVRSIKKDIKILVELNGGKPSGRKGLKPGNYTVKF